MWGYEFIVNTIVRHCSTLCQDMYLLSTQLFGIVQRYMRIWLYCQHNCSTLFNAMRGYEFIVNTIVRHCSTLCEDMYLLSTQLLACHTIVRHCSTLCEDMTLLLTQLIGIVQRYIMNLFPTQLFGIVQRYVWIWIYCQHNCSTLFNAMWGYEFIVNTIVRHCSTLCQDIWIYCQHNCSALFNAMWGYEFIVNTIVRHCSTLCEDMNLLFTIVRHCSTLCEDMNLLSTQLFGIVQLYVRIWIYCQHNCSTLFNAMWGYEFIVNTIVRHCSTLCEIWIYCQHNCSALFNAMWGYEFIVNTIVRHCSTLCEDMNLLSTQLFGIVQRCEDMNLLSTQLFGIVQLYVMIWIYCQHNCSALFNSMWGYEFIVNTIVRHCSTLCEDMNLLSTQLFGIVQRYVRIWIYCQHNCSALFNSMWGYEFIVNTIVRHCSTLCEDMEFIVNTIVRHCSTLCEDMNLLSTQLFGIVQHWGYEFIQHNCSIERYVWIFIVNTIVRHCSTLCEDMNLLSTQLFDIVQRYVRIWIYCQHNCSALFNAMWGYEFIVNTIVRHCSTICEDMNLFPTQLFGIVQRYVWIWIYCQHNCSTLFNAMWGYEFIVNTIVRHCSTICEDMNLFNTIVRHCSTLCLDMNLLSTQLFGIVQRYVRIWIYCQHNCSALFNAMWGYDLLSTQLFDCSTQHNCSALFNAMSTQLFDIVQRYVRIWIYC